MKENMRIIMLNIFVFEKVYTFSFVKANIWSQLTTYSRTTYFFSVSLGRYSYVFREVCTSD